jgi:hypothetical protein
VGHGSRFAASSCSSGLLAPGKRYAAALSLKLAHRASQTKRYFPLEIPFLLILSVNSSPKNEFPALSFQTHFSPFCTLFHSCRNKSCANVTQNTLGYTPSPRDLRRSLAIILKFNLRSGTLFPFLRRTAFPIWLLLATPAT